MCIRDSCTVTELLIQQNSLGEYFIGSTVYKSLKELIDFYIIHGEQLSSVGETILTPVSKFDKWTMNYADIEVQKKIGNSSHFGEICEALDKRTGAKAIIKSYAGNRPESINEFLLEAEVLKQCNSPNVVR